MRDDMSSSSREAPGGLGEIFFAFLKLGLTSFGGPIAHLGYFRDALILRRRRMEEAAYADLVGLCLVEPILHGLQLVAVAVVAQAVRGMAKTLTPDRQRAAIALPAVAITTFFGSGFGQILAIALGHVVLPLLRTEVVAPDGYKRYILDRLRSCPS